MSEDTRSELKRPRPETSQSTIVSLSSKSPVTKKLNFKIPPKSKIIKTNPNLTGEGDSVLKALHHQHFENFKSNLRVPLYKNLKPQRFSMKHTVKSMIPSKKN